MRASAERYRAQAKADWDSGAGQRIGAAIFVFDAVMAARGHDGTLVPLAELCWVYRRQITQWNRIPPLPFLRTHEVVLHRARGEGLTVWNRLSFYGSREEVNRAISELMKRAPWALFGYTSEARTAMAPGRVAQTTREIHDRRLSGALQGAAASLRYEATADSLEAERLTAFRSIVSPPHVPD